jgi:sugar phosphate isomerase/epimerase
VHVKDSHRFSPDFFDLTLTGSGTMPIGDVVTVLQEAGYDGFVDFEWEKAWHPEIEEPEIAIPQFIQYLRRLI